MKWFIAWLLSLIGIYITFFIAGFSLRELTTNSDLAAHLIALTVAAITATIGYYSTKALEKNLKKG